jgi:hypothetical protein
MGEDTAIDFAGFKVLVTGGEKHEGSRAHSASIGEVKSVAAPEEHMEGHIASV